MLKENGRYTVLGAIVAAVGATAEGLTMRELMRYPTLYNLVNSQKISPTEAARIIKEVKEKEA